MVRQVRLEGGFAGACVAEVGEGDGAGRPAGARGLEQCPPVSIHSIASMGREWGTSTRTSLDMEAEVRVAAGRIT